MDVAKILQYTRWPLQPKKCSLPNLKYETLPGGLRHPQAAPSHLGNGLWGEAKNGLNIHWRSLVFGHYGHFAGLARER